MTQHGDSDRFEGGAKTAHGALAGQRYLIHETAQHSHSNANGGIVVDPGEKAEILWWDDNGPLHLYALGANDVADVEYQLKIDGDIVASTQSPLGTINDPFSFPRQLGTAVEADQRVAYQVVNNGDTAKEMAARAHLGVLG